MSPKVRTLLALVAVIVPLDQLTKSLVSSGIERGSYWAPIPALEGFFRITHARNPGIALGMFQEMPWFVPVALTVVALIMIYSFFRRLEPNDRLSALSLALIIGGALGNALDRVFRSGEVVDFLQFNLGLFIFPDFNVADAAISIGVALLLLDVVTHETEEGVTRKTVPGEKES
jgi:signal peptidase II